MAVAFALVGLVGAGGVRAGEVPSSRGAFLGGHVPELSNWTAQVYADVLKQGAPWEAAGGSPTSLAKQGRLDDNGHPTTDCRIWFIGGTGPGPASVIAGTYKLSFRGTAKVSIGDAGSVVNSRYDPETNTTTADVVLPESGPNYFLDFRDAWRNAGRAPDATGNARGITHARLMAPGHAWPSDYWRKELVATRGVFGLMRFSAALGPGDGAHSCNHRHTGVMGSCDTTWSTRARPGFYGYMAKGMPWEDVVVFANTTGMDVWINIPIGADDDYVRKVFQLLKYGSDGNLPYAAEAHDPASWTPEASWYPGLVAGRKAYVEFSNEIWNYYDGDQLADREIAAGDPHHLLGKGRFGRDWRGDRWVAWNAVRLGLIARQVWGDAAMQRTIRIVYANQGDWDRWHRHDMGLQYIEHVWGPSSPFARIGGFTVPRKPVAYYIHNASGSFYVHAPVDGRGAPTARTPDELFSQLEASLRRPGGLREIGESNCVEQRVRFAEATAERYRIAFTAYETGIEVFQQGSLKSAWAHPRMRTLVHGLLRLLTSGRSADVAVQSATVRGAAPGNELSPSYAASDGFPWPLRGNAVPSPAWQAVLDVRAGR